MLASKGKEQHSNDDVENAERESGLRKAHGATLPENAGIPGFGHRGVPRPAGGQVAESELSYSDCDVELNVRPRTEADMSSRTNQSHQLTGVCARRRS